MDFLDDEQAADDVTNLFSILTKPPPETLYVYAVSQLSTGRRSCEQNRLRLKWMRPQRFEIIESEKLTVQDFARR